MSILLKGSEDEQINFAFKMLDIGGNGVLKKQAFDAIKEVIKYFSVASDNNSQIADKIINLLDPNGTRNLSYLEFQKIIKENRIFFQTLGKIDGKNKENPDSSENPEEISEENKFVAENFLKSKFENVRTNKKLKGAPIVFGHELWEFTWYIMSGISKSVQTAECTIQMRELEFLFNQERIYKLPFIQANCIFVDFAPCIFHLIRKQFQTDSINYLLSLGTEQFLGNLLMGKLNAFMDCTGSSSGRSKSLFFATHDEKYLIKTIADEEDATLCSILKSYFEFIKENKNTLLARIFSLHRTRFINNSSIIIMKNLFYSDNAIQIHEIYDLKGSTIDRHVDKKDDSEVVALKDNNFRRTLNFGPLAKAFFLEQIERDIRWMESHNICDYSLLLGIHFRDSTSSSSSSITPTTSSSAVPNANPSASNVLHSTFSSANFSSISSTSTTTSPTNSFSVENNNSTNGATSSNSSAEQSPIPFDDWENAPTLNEILANSDESSDPPDFSFNHFHGGILSNDRKEVYYISIIDILTTYDLKKKGENLLKSVFNDPNQISAIPSKDYRKRFQKKIISIVR